MIVRGLDALAAAVAREVGGTPGKSGEESEEGTIPYSLYASRGALFCFRSSPAGSFRIVAAGHTAPSTAF